MSVDQSVFQPEDVCFHICQLQLQVSLKSGDRVNKRKVGGGGCGEGGVNLSTKPRKSGSTLSSRLTLATKVCLGRVKRDETNWGRFLF